MDPADTRIGWIGLGVMGGAMAGHLLEAGHPLTVLSRTRAKAQPLLARGADWAASPARVAEASDVVFVMVGFPQDVRDVVLGTDGVLAGARPGTVVVDCTTSEPSLAVEIADAGREVGVATLDAPVSGGDVGAREARLSIMVGGAEDAFECVEPILSRLGATVVRQGGPGAGQHTKMVNQTLIASNMIGVCEALLYAHQAGLEPERVLSSVSSGAAGSWSLANLAPRILAGDFAPGFYVEHFVKDMGIALAEAEAMGLELPGPGTGAAALHLAGGGRAGSGRNPGARLRAGGALHGGRLAARPADPAIVKNLVIGVLAAALLVSSGGAFFFWRLAGLRAPAPGGDARPELAELESAAAWRSLVETLRRAGDEVVGAGPDGAPSPQDAIERFRGLLAILSNTTRLPFNSDPARPLIVVSDLQPALTKIGGNSPDAEYHSFPVSAEYRYRLRGRRSRAAFFNIQVQSLEFDLASMRPQVLLTSSLSGDELTYDENDRFEVWISRDPPDDPDLAWLRMDERSFVAVAREYHHDAVAEGDPDLRVEVLGDVPPPQPRSDAEVAQAIRQADFMSRFWFDARQWLPEILAQDAVNRFSAADESAADLGLNVDVHYRVAAWRLAPDEILVVEGRFPPETPYWIFQITDRWQDTADFRRRHVHVNDSTVALEPDGRFRIVVASRDPGAPNWLDTGGREEGFMSFRWVPTQEGFEVETRVESLGASSRR